MTHSGSRLQVLVNGSLSQGDTNLSSWFASRRCYKLNNMAHSVDVKHVLRYDSLVEHVTNQL